MRLVDASVNVHSASIGERERASATQVDEAQWRSFLHEQYATLLIEFK